MPSKNRKGSNTISHASGDTWNVNHCYARIRILTAYCMFLLKRAHYYSSDHRKSGLIEFVKGQYDEILDYKTQITELEIQASKTANHVSPGREEEIRQLVKTLKARIDNTFNELAAKVSEKVAGEPAANAYQLTNDELESLLESSDESLRRW